MSLAVDLLWAILAEMHQQSLDGTLKSACFHRERTRGIYY
jgi:hypothetical protein